MKKTLEISFFRRRISTEFTTILQQGIIQKCPIFSIKKSLVIIMVSGLRYMITTFHELVRESSARLEKHCIRERGGICIVLFLVLGFFSVRTII